MPSLVRGTVPGSGSASDKANTAHCVDFMAAAMSAGEVGRAAWVKSNLASPHGADPSK